MHSYPLTLHRSSTTNVLWFNFGLGKAKVYSCDLNSHHYSHNRLSNPSLCQTYSFSAAAGVEFF